VCGLPLPAQSNCARGGLQRPTGISPAQQRMLQLGDLPRLPEQSACSQLMLQSWHLHCSEMGRNLLILGYHHRKLAYGLV